MQSETKDLPNMPTSWEKDVGHYRVASGSDFCDKTHTPTTHGDPLKVVSVQHRETYQSLSAYVREMVATEILDALQSRTHLDPWTLVK